MRHAPRPLSRMAGMSIIELMIAIALGLIVLAGLATLFANQSAARAELERSSRQIENGRFAMELISDDLRMAGFWGELNLIPANFPLPGAMLDPCSTVKADWVSAMRHHVQGYDDNAISPLPCMDADIQPNTDVLVVRRVSTCEAGAPNCDAAANSKPYIQVARCAVEVANPLPDQAFELGLRGTQGFTRTRRDCATPAALREYFVRVYYVSKNNGAGADIPTLKRLDLNATASGFVVTPMVEGIENLQLEYGLDLDGDADPDVYTPDPTNYVCAGCTAQSNWANAITARIYLLARNTEATVNYTDKKTYHLGRTAAGASNDFTPGGPYRRHAYSGLVRIVNATERRDTP